MLPEVVAEEDKARLGALAAATVDHDVMRGRARAHRPRRCAHLVLEPPPPPHSLTLYISHPFV